MLSEEQIEQYGRDGYLLVSGLIPEETITKAESAMWSELGMKSDDSSTWSFPDSSEGVAVNAKQGLINHYGLQHPDLLACCTPSFYEANIQLAQANLRAFHCQNQNPEALWTLSIFPVDRSWNHGEPHIDGGFRPIETMPGGFRVTSLTYLNEIAKHGGGTVVCPGSHRKLIKAVRKDPEQYRFITDFKESLQQFDLGEPVELRPSRGDVLFFHYLLAHSGSLNTGRRPRFALRWMCSCEGCRMWQKQGNWNVWMP